MYLSRRAAIAAGVATLSGCSARSRSGSPTRIRGPQRWETYGRDSTHRGSTDSGFVSNEAPSIEWSTRLNGTFATSPVASEDFVVVGNERDVYVSSLDGLEFSIWLEPPGSLAGTPCLDGETVYVVSDERFDRSDVTHVSAMTVDGVTTWTADLPAALGSSPTVRDGTVYVRTSEEYVALDAASGDVRWRTSANGSLTRNREELENVGPAVGRDVVVFPDLAGLTVVDRDDGTELWRRRLVMVRSPPVIADDTVYVADVYQGVRAFDLETGDGRWRWSGSRCWAPPVVTDRHVYAAEMREASDPPMAAFVVALDRESGEVVWEMADPGLQGAVASGFSVVGNTILAGSENVGLASVSADRTWPGANPGTVQWSLDGASATTPIAVGDRIAFVGFDVTDVATMSRPVLYVLQ